jgi:L-amino acid N-acyltransferase YncA
MNTALLPLELLHRGKVREVYRVDDERLLLVASDRVSAFDVVLPQPIPRKGEVLTQLTTWWMDRLKDQVADHYISVDPDVIRAAVPALAGVEGWERRSTLVHRTDPMPVECVVRGYVSGSAWKEYKEAGTLAGEPLPAGLRESDRLAAPIFSPATKATTGHDENIPFDGVVDRLGLEMAERLRTGREEGYPWLIAENDGVVVGFAYAGPYRERRGYRHAVQDAIYMAPTARGRGVGRALLTALIDEAERLGFRQMIAIIGDSANRASIQLHAALGFMPIGVLHDVGRKHGRWLDTVMMQLSLGKGALDAPDDEVGSGDGESGP